MHFGMALPQLSTQLNKRIELDVRGKPKVWDRALRLCHARRDDFAHRRQGNDLEGFTHVSSDPHTERPLLANL